MMLPVLSKNPRVWLKIVVVGGLCGALCDQIHIQGGVLYYAQPVILQQAWWVALLFAGASCLIYATTSLWAQPAEQRVAAVVSAPEIARQVLWFVAMYALSAGMRDRSLALVVLYAILMVRRMVRRRDVWPQLANATGLAVGGTAFEMALSSTGAFTYTHPDFAGVPLWLPGLYMHGAPLALALVRAIRQLESPSAAVKAEH
ncbi:MAG: DUF2878 family protein [Myxococcales bacterium]|nr:DUF2878 family protein [Myxococcales bacterium]